MCPSEKEPSIETASCGRNIILTPIVMVQRLEGLLRIREVPGSISDRRHYEGLCVILQYFQAKVWKLFQVSPQALPSTSHPIQQSLIILPLTLMQYELQAALLN
jgi:hypothetical protein